MVSAEFSDLSAALPTAAAGPGGFVLFGEPPAGSGPQISSGLAALAAAATAAHRVVPWMSTDEEGGEVARLADVLGALPAPRQMAAEWSTAETESEIAAHARAMRAIGMTMDLAPVLDTAPPTDMVADENQRSFSDDPQVATAYGLAFVDGLRAAGVVPVVKHFPGLGHANANTDLGPATDPPLSELETEDLIPFEHLIDDGVPVVMVGHPVVPGLTDGKPASLAPATYAYLRQTLHFSGVAMTDALGAGAITDLGYSEQSAAVVAIEAGADMVIIDDTSWAQAVQALDAAITSGALPEWQVQASIRRILAAKDVRVCGT